MSGRIIIGDALRELRKMPDESVNCVVTSPPYFGLRDYGMKGQIGLERTFGRYLEKLVAVFREVRRVLRSDGTCWVNMGDSYAGSWGAQSRPDGNLKGASVLHARQIAAHPKATRTGNLERFSSRRDKAVVAGPAHLSVSGIKPKNLVGQPWRLAFALQADGWWLRSDIIWSKPQPMPESVSDRPTRAHEYLFLLTKSARYWYDADAIKEPVSGEAHRRFAGHIVAKNATRAPDGLRTSASFGRGAGFRAGKNETTGDRTKEGFNERWKVKNNDLFHAGTGDLVENRNKRSVWTIPTQPNPDAHFASFPEALVTPCVLAGCPGGGVVLDPFGGTGTVARVAEDLGRGWILIELNPEYAAMAKRRLRQTGLLQRVATAPDQSQATEQLDLGGAA